MSWSSHNCLTILYCFCRIVIFNRYALNFALLTNNAIKSNFKLSSDRTHMYLKSTNF